MHALGLRLLRRDTPDAQVDVNKLFRLWRAAYTGPIYNPSTGHMLRTAVDHWRQTRRYIDQRRNEGRVVDHPVHDDDNAVSPVARRVWLDAIRDRGNLEQDETIFHCLYFGVSPNEAERFDVVLVTRKKTHAKAFSIFLSASMIFFFLTRAVLFRQRRMSRSQSSQYRIL